MIAQKHQKPSKRQLKIQLKLPEINPRKNVQSAKKNLLLIPHLPQINNISNHKNILINKENNSLNLVNRKHSFDDQIKARLFQVEAADKMVKNILGAPEATVNIGGDMTNFQHKIEANKNYLRRQRKRSHFQQHNPNIPQEKKYIPTSPKYKSVSSKQIFPNHHKIKQQMKIKIQQNHEPETAREGKKQKTHQNQDSIKNKFKSERIPINHDKKISKNQNSQIFNSIRQLLSDPQKNMSVEAKKVNRLVKFTIQELENRLNKMNNMDGNKSYFEGSDNKNDNGSLDRKLSSAKSVGMIPLSALPVTNDYTYKNWNRVQFGGNNQIDGENSNNGIKYHKSNFNDEVDHIKKLQMKSYKSIQKMVENRKLLIDLQLMKKNKSALMVIQQK